MTTRHYELHYNFGLRQTSYEENGCVEVSSHLSVDVLVQNIKKNNSAM
ncbi:hypothetical protein [Falsiporphyromonas endometrii]|uniref:Uncharacterized protein n=1 Tax=Falsiporphyromonas endometrii TaxID=1387297 RepID=A0ABV9K6I3_9PORP